MMTHSKTAYTSVIIDDEALCIDNLKKSLQRYSQITLAGTACNVSDGRALVLQQTPDLLFLDVELGDMSGLEFLHTLRDEVYWPMQVVFYTAYEKYLLEALRESAFDFLLKPFTPEDFNLVINRFLSHVSKIQAGHTFHDRISRVLPENKVLMIATVTGFQLLQKEKIGYFEYSKEQKQWQAVVIDGQRLPLKRSTTAEDILHYATSFVRINQQQIVNIDYLCMIKAKECVLQPPFQNETPFLISRTCFKALQEKFEMI
ncbi:LytR/AlgR family response regulator transcription factor [Microbacter margulisiae]|uniref:Two-component system LytT family response regulator n=1 Tax=Microbacter margulisiae TaxID=1350067 RepID=A0A7W5DS82_9PORP|nr:response regulator transcription factor [Microbacter margulisiae]MBB3187845.1 two-component system LytT family response regulator [Microbacter margulisiae]